MAIRRLSRLHKPDLIFLACFAFIAIFGLVMLSSVSTAVAFQRFGDSLYYVKYQLTRGFIPGLFAFAFFALIDYRMWRRFGFTIFVASIVLLLAVFIPGLGVSYGGAKSWLDLGILQFQPAEVTKLAFILYLAAWLEKRDKHVIKDFSDGLRPFLTSLGIVMLLIFLQPDVGTMTVIAMISFMIYFTAGASLKHLFGLGILGVGALAFLIKIAPYRAARFTVFLHPELDPQGIGYHINQALLAIGSGGIFGLGFGYSRQKHLYLPEVIGDSAFAIVAEELGFVAVCVVLIIFMTMLYRGFRVAREAPDNFGRFVAAGVMSWIGFQSLINISAMVGLLPITGLPLPFISYGSTSLIVLFAAMGIVTNISRQTVDVGSKKSKIMKMVKAPASA
jgi:cell division protein FtsW